MIHEAIRSIMVADATIAAIVGTKVFAHAAPNNSVVKLPYIIYSTISENPHTHSTSTGSGSMESRIQVDCWSTDYSEVKTLAQAVRVALTGASGTYNNTNVQAVLTDGSRDYYENPQSGDEEGIYRVSEDYLVWSS